MRVRDPQFAADAGNLAEQVDRAPWCLDPDDDARMIGLLDADDNVGHRTATLFAYSI
jgi:hypothetical protein